MSIRKYGYYFEVEQQSPGRAQESPLTAEPKTNEGHCQKKTRAQIIGKDRTCASFAKDNHFVLKSIFHLEESH